MPLTEQRMLSLDLYRRPDGQLDFNTVTACLYGNRDYYVALTILCMRFTLKLFPHVPDPGSDLPQYPNELAETIRFALWRGKATPTVVIKALYFLKKLKGFYPYASIAAKASPLQILAATLVAAHKEHIEPFDTYSNKDWAEKIWQKLFELRVFNQMERELVNHLKHDLRIDNQTFVHFVYELYAEVPWEFPPPPSTSAVALGNRASGSGPSTIGRGVTSGTLSAQRQRDIHAYGLDPTTAPKAIAQPGTASSSLATTYGYQSGLAVTLHGGYVGSSGHALPRDVDSEHRGRSRKREKAKGSKWSESLGIFSRLLG
ncbi:hypothetical protein K466DRAFT_605320 [Polyporus arcularius HHB13444]|uniref:Cyclin N-terminal domain-containing protein n=1 Tax=Polyporus arcularius HHB13444 TaxID=1314778 RepID=A0A5C3NTX7_9APHY|nr:hypothetical protein K466DRAFT_605320 [Polyporus arcularius HHB13444]